jgi:hypothetical protein
MSVHASPSAAPARRPLRSFGAILLGLVVVVALSTVTDQVMHAVGVFPPAGEPMEDPALFALALAYRCAFTVLGGYATARFAPRAGLTHAVILGVIGTCLAIAGAVATVGRPELGPAWYPIALVITGLPCTWLGGVLHGRTRPAA